MAKLSQFCLALLLAITLVGLSVSVPSPEASPGPSPKPGAGVPSPNAQVLTATAIPSPASSPPAPPLADLAPSSSLEALPSKLSTPTPDASNTGNVNNNMSADGSKKAGIAIKVILAVVVGGVVYKKRQHNIRRSQYR